MWKKIALGSLVLWIGTISFLAYKFIEGNATKVDNRTEILLTAGDRDLILGEMRTLLKGVQGIIRGLSVNDNSLIEISARGNGMQMAQDVNPALMMKLPQTFKAMGMSVHKDFDDLAGKVHQLNSNEILNQLDATLNKCISCHQMFKIVEE